MALFGRSGVRSIVPLLAVAVLVSACGIETNELLQSSPPLVGNTFDRYNDLGVAYPESENVNISYEFGFVDDFTVTVAGQFTGQAWLFRENSAATPESFVTLHLVTPDAGAEKEVGLKLSLGNGEFTVKDYCVDIPAGDAPERVAPYLAAIASNGFQLSDSVFVRRFVSTEPGRDGRRIDVVFVEDIVRKGYSCADFEDLEDLEDDREAFIEGLRARAQRTFEVVG